MRRGRIIGGTPILESLIGGVSIDIEGDITVRNITIG